MTDAAHVTSRHHLRVAREGEARADVSDALAKFQSTANALQAIGYGAADVERLELAIPIGKSLGGDFDIVNGIVYRVSENLPATDKVWGKVINVVFVNWVGP